MGKLDMGVRQDDEHLRDFHESISRRIVEMAERERKRLKMTKVAFSAYVGFASRPYDLYVGGFRTVGLGFLVRFVDKFGWDMNEIFYGKPRATKA